MNVYVAAVVFVGFDIYAILAIGRVGASLGVVWTFPFDFFYEVLEDFFEDCFC